MPWSQQHSASHSQLGRVAPDSALGWSALAAAKAAACPGHAFDCHSRTRCHRALRAAGAARAAGVKRHLRLPGAAALRPLLRLPYAGRSCWILCTYLPAVLLVSLSAIAFLAMGQAVQHPEKLWSIFVAAAADFLGRMPAFVGAFLDKLAKMAFEKLLDFPPEPAPSLAVQPVTPLAPEPQASTAWFFIVVALGAGWALRPSIPLLRGAHPVGLVLAASAGFRMQTHTSTSGSPAAVCTPFR
jgi:hypothetical protein